MDLLHYLFSDVTTCTVVMIMHNIAYLVTMWLCILLIYSKTNH